MVGENSPIELAHSRRLTGNPRDRGEMGDLSGERGDHLLDLRRQFPDGLVQEIQVRKERAHEEGVVVSEPPGERLAQGRDLLAEHPRAGSDKTSGSRIPATGAASMSRPEAPRMSVATEDSLITRLRDGPYAVPIGRDAGTIRNPGRVDRRPCACWRGAAESRTRAIAHMKALIVTATYYRRRALRSSPTEQQIVRCPAAADHAPPPVPGWGPPGQPGAAPIELSRLAHDPETRA